MIDFVPYITLTKTITLACGGLVTLFATRAFRRTHSPALGWLALGFGLVTVGGLIAGALHEIVELSLTESIVVHSTFTAAGFLVLAYAVYARWDPDPSPADEITTPR